MEEIWKDIEGYKGLYQVSNLGQVRSLNYHMQKGNIKIMKQQKVRGYLVVEIHNKNRGKSKRTIYYIHRLVAQAFIPNPNNYPEVNHKDERPENNFVYVNEGGTVNIEKSNLEWCTEKYNNNYGTRLSRALETKKINGKRNKPVNQYDMDGNLIKRWESGTIAAEELGLCQGSISRCCLKQRNSYNGFIWRYAD